MTQPKPEPIGTKRGLPVYPTLIEIAEAEAADAYDATGSRFYRIMVQPADEMGNPLPIDSGAEKVPYYAPWSGGGCYPAARLLNDERMREAIRRTAAMRTRMRATMGDQR